MKKNVILFAALVCSILFVQGQEISWGSSKEGGGSDDAYLPLGFSGENYYCIQFDGTDGYLITVDKSYNLKTKVALITGAKKFEAEAAFLIKDKIYVFNSEYENKDKAVYVQATVFNTQGRAIGAKLKRVLTIDVEKNGEVEYLSYAISADSSKLAVMMDHDVSNKDDAKISLGVLNIEDLSTITSYQTTIPYENADFAALSLAVDSKGRALMLGVVRGGEGKRLQKYSTRMFSFSAGAKKYDDRELKIEGKFISSAFIRFATDEKLMITGFYNGLTDKGKSEGIEGAFISTVIIEGLDNPDLHIEKIDPIVKASITPQGGLAKMFNQDELNAYYIRTIALHPDGSGYVIAEQRAIVVSENDQSYTKTAYFNHMIVYRFDANQEITTISAIPKEQVTSITTAKLNFGIVSIRIWTGSMQRRLYKYNSYLDTEIDGDIYIMYNDHRDNGNARTIKEVKTMSNKKNANAVVVKVGAGGDWDKETLFSGKEVDVILETSSSYAIPGVGFVISAEKGKILQYGKCELK